MDNFKGFSKFESIGAISATALGASAAVSAHTDKAHKKQTRHHIMLRQLFDGIIPPEQYITDQTYDERHPDKIAMDVAGATKYVESPDIKKFYAPYKDFNKTFKGINGPSRTLL